MTTDRADRLFARLTPTMEHINNTVLLKRLTRCVCYLYVYVSGFNGTVCAVCLHRNSNDPA